MVFIFGSKYDYTSIQTFQLLTQSILRRYWSNHKILITKRTNKKQTADYKRSGRQKKVCQIEDI
jgi:hypothetical protein